jgi:hypothetical protein
MRYLVEVEGEPGAPELDLANELKLRPRSGLTLVKVEKYTPPAPPAGAEKIRKYRVHVKSASCGDRDYLVFAVDERHAREELERTGYSGRITSLVRVNE